MYNPYSSGLLSENDNEVVVVFDNDVLILILMDYSLRVKLTVANAGTENVLILILMDYSLRHLTL